MEESTTDRVNSTPQFVHFVGQTTSEKILKTTLFGLVQLIGICGNCLVIISISRERQLRSNHYFVVNILAVLDLIMLLSSLFENSIRPWHAGAATITESSIIFCKIWNVWRHWLVIVEAQLLLIIGVLRYRAVCRPHQPALQRRKLMSCVGFFTFFLPTVWLIPYFLARNIQDGKCSETWIGNILYDIYYIADVVYTLFLPLLLLSILYSMVYRGLMSHQRQMNSTLETANEDQHSSARHARNKRISKVAVTIVVVFAISSLPSTIGWLLLAYSGVYNYRFMEWSILIYYGGVSAANPIVYGIQDKAIRCGYNRSLKKLWQWFKFKTRGSYNVPS